MDALVSVVEVVVALMAIVMMVVIMVSIKSRYVWHLASLYLLVIIAYILSKWF